MYAGCRFSGESRHGSGPSDVCSVSMLKMAQKEPIEGAEKSDIPDAGEIRINYPMLGEKIAGRLAQQYPQLTARERLVCGYTLAGYTAEGIGLILGVGMSTIITYRRRAYSRLGVCNANQLIAPLLA